MKKPDFKETKALISLMRECAANLKRVSRCEKDHPDAVRTALRAYYHARAMEILKTVPIEEINRTESVRIAVLKKNNINTVYDAVMKGRDELISFDGIGRDSADRILNVVSGMIDAIRKDTPLRIDPDDLHEEEKNILLSTYILKRAENTVAQGVQMEQKYGKKLEEALEKAGMIRNSFQWLFSSKDKKEITCRGIESLQELYEEIYMPAASLSETVTSYQHVSGTEVVSAFTADPVSFYALLEQFSDIPIYTADLSDELISEIEKQPFDEEILDLTLRRYQVFGTKYILHQKRVLLGDEMGLGKTIQAIAAMAELSEQGRTHFLVAAPLSILRNWEREIRRACQLTPYVIHGDKRNEYRLWINKGGVAITNYETLLKLEIPEDLQIDLIAADEAHYLKNPKARRTQAFLKFADRSEYIVYMTGTPLENNVDEFCYLLSCLSPETAREVQDIRYLAKAELFRKKIAPVYLRRRREDVLQELPEITWSNEWTDMTFSEFEAYRDSVMAGNFMEMRRVSWNALESMKAARLLELCNDAASEHRKVIVFSYFRETLQFVEKLLSERISGIITGSTPAAMRLQIIDEFNKSEDRDILVAQIQAGGTGLNIQSASVVIFCEPQIKPSFEQQAVSRVYRMGQIRHVLVYRLLSAASVDEHILVLLENKQEIFDVYADTSFVNQQQTEADAAWIKDLIEMEKDRLTYTKNEA